MDSDIGESQTDTVDSNQRENAVFQERSGILSYTLSTVQRMNCLNRRRPGLSQSISQHTGHLYGDRNIFGSLAHDEAFSREMFADTNDHSLSSSVRRNWKKLPSKDDTFQQSQPVIWKSKPHSEETLMRSVSDIGSVNQPLNGKHLLTGKDHDTSEVCPENQPFSGRPALSGKDHDTAFVTGIMDNQHTLSQDWETHMKMLAKEIPSDDLDKASRPSSDSKPNKTTENRDEKVMKSKNLNNKQSVQITLGQNKSVKHPMSQDLNNRLVSKTVEGNKSEVSKRVSFGDVKYRYIDPRAKSGTVSKKGIGLNQKIDKSTGKPITLKQEDKQGKVKDKIMVDALKKTPITRAKKTCPSSEIKQRAKELKEALGKQNVQGSKVQKIVEDKAVGLGKSDIVEIHTGEKKRNDTGEKGLKPMILQDNFEKEKTYKVTAHKGDSEVKTTKTLKRVSFGETTYRFIEQRPITNTKKDKSAALSNKIDKASKKTVNHMDTSKRNQREQYLVKTKVTENLSGPSLKDVEVKAPDFSTQKLDKGMISENKRSELPASVKHKTEIMKQPGITASEFSGIKSQKRKLMPDQRGDINNEHRKLKKPSEKIKDSPNKENNSLCAEKHLVPYTSDKESKEKQTNVLIKSDATKTCSLTEQRKEKPIMSATGTQGSNIVQSNTQKTCKESKTNGNLSGNLSKENPSIGKSRTDSNDITTKTSGASVINVRTVVDQKASKKSAKDPPSVVRISTEKTSMSPLQLQVETVRESKMLKSKPAAPHSQGTEKYDSDTESSSETESLPSLDDFPLASRKFIEQCLSAWSVFYNGVSKTDMKLSCKTVSQTEIEIEKTPSKLPIRTNSESVIDYSKKLSLEKNTQIATHELTTAKSGDKVIVSKTNDDKGSKTTVKTPAAKVNYPNTTRLATASLVTVSSRVSGNVNQSTVGFTSSGLSKSSILASGVSSGANISDTNTTTKPLNNALGSAPQMPRKNSVPLKILQSSCKSGIPVASKVSVSVDPPVVNQKCQGGPTHQGHVTTVCVPQRSIKSSNDNIRKPINNVPDQHSAATFDSLTAVSKSRSSFSQNAVSTTTSAVSQAISSNYKHSLTYTNKIQGLNRYKTTAVVQKTKVSGPDSRSRTPATFYQGIQDYSFRNVLSTTNSLDQSLGQHASQSNISPRTNFFPGDAPVQNNGTSARVFPRSHLPSYYQSVNAVRDRIQSVHDPPSIVPQKNTVESHQPTCFPQPNNRPLNNMQGSLHSSLHEPSHINESNPPFPSMPRLMSSSQILQQNVRERYNQVQTNYAAIGHTNHQVHYSVPPYNARNNHTMSSFKYPVSQSSSYRYPVTQLPGHNSSCTVYGMTNPNFCQYSSSSFGSWGNTCNSFGYNGYGYDQVNSYPTVNDDYQCTIDQFGSLRSDIHTRTNVNQQNIPPTIPFCGANISNCTGNHSNEFINDQVHQGISRGIQDQISNSFGVQQFMNQGYRNAQTNPTVDSYTGQTYRSNLASDRLIGACLPCFDRQNECQSVPKTNPESSVLDISPTISRDMPEQELSDSNIINLISDYLDDYSEKSLKATMKVYDKASDERTVTDSISSKTWTTTGETFSVYKNSDTDLYDTINRSPPILSPIPNRQVMNKSYKVLDKTGRGNPLKNSPYNDTADKDVFKDKRNEAATQLEMKNKQVAHTNTTVITHDKSYLKSSTADNRSELIEEINKQIADTSKTVMKHDKFELKSNTPVKRSEKTGDMIMSGDNIVKNDKQITTRGKMELTKQSNKVFENETNKLFENAKQRDPIDKCRSNNKTESHLFKDTRNGTATKLEIKNKQAADTNKKVNKPDQSEIKCDKSEVKTSSERPYQGSYKSKKIEEVNSVVNSLLKADEQTASGDLLGTDTQTTSKDRVVKDFKLNRNKTLVADGKDKAASKIFNSEMPATEQTNSVKVSSESVNADSKVVSNPRCKDKVELETDKAVFKVVSKPRFRDNVELEIDQAASKVGSKLRYKEKVELETDKADLKVGSKPRLQDNAELETDKALPKTPSTMITATKQTNSIKVSSKSVKTDSKVASKQKCKEEVELETNQADSKFGSKLRSKYKVEIKTDQADSKVSSKPRSKDKVELETDQADSKASNKPRSRDKVESKAESKGPSSKTATEQKISGKVSSQSFRADSKFVSKPRCKDRVESETSNAKIPFNEMTNIVKTSTQSARNESVVSCKSNCMDKVKLKSLDSNLFAPEIANTNKTDMHPVSPESTVKSKITSMPDEHDRLLSNKGMSNTEQDTKSKSLNRHNVVDSSNLKKLVSPNVKTLSEKRSMPVDSISNIAGSRLSEVGKYGNIFSSLQNCLACPRLKNKGANALSDLQNSMASPRFENNKPCDVKKKVEKDTPEPIFEKSDKVKSLKRKQNTAKSVQLCGETSNEMNVISAKKAKVVGKNDCESNKAAFSLAKVKATVTADVQYEQKQERKVIDTHDSKQLGSAVIASETEKETNDTKSTVMKVKDPGVWKLQQDEILLGSAARFLGDFNINIPRTRKRPILYDSYACTDETESDIGKIETRSRSSRTQILNSNQKVRSGIVLHSLEKRRREELDLPEHTAEAEPAEDLQSVTEEIPKTKKRGRPKKKAKIQGLESKIIETKVNDTDPVPIEDFSLKVTSDEKVLIDSVSDAEKITNTLHVKLKSRKFKGKKYKGKASFRVKLTDIMCEKGSRTLQVESKKAVIESKEALKDIDMAKDILPYRESKESRKEKNCTKRKVSSDKKTVKKRKVEAELAVSKKKSGKAPRDGAKIGSGEMIQESQCQICRMKIMFGGLYSHFRNYHPISCEVCYEEFPTKVSSSRRVFCYN